jgi:hypothetical protein
MIRTVKRAGIRHLAARTPEAIAIEEMNMVVTLGE